MAVLSRHERIDGDAMNRDDLLYAKFMQEAVQVRLDSLTKLEVIRDLISLRDNPDDAWPHAAESIDDFICRVQEMPMRRLAMVRFH